MSRWRAVGVGQDEPITMQQALAYAQAHPGTDEAAVIMQAVQANLSQAIRNSQAQDSQQTADMLSGAAAPDPLLSTEGIPIKVGDQTLLVNPQTGQVMQSFGDPNQGLSTYTQEQQLAHDLQSQESQQTYQQNAALQNQKFQQSMQELGLSNDPLQNMAPKWTAPSIEKGPNGEMDYFDPNSGLFQPLRQADAPSVTEAGGMIFVPPGAQADIYGYPNAGAAPVHASGGPQPQTQPARLPSQMAQAQQLAPLLRRNQSPGMWNGYGGAGAPGGAAGGMGALGGLAGGAPPMTPRAMPQQPQPSWQPNVGGVPYWPAQPMGTGGITPESFFGPN